MDTKPENDCARAYEAPNILENNAITFYIGATKRIFLKRLKEHERANLQYHQTASLARFQQSSEIHRLKETNLTLPCNTAINNLQKKSIIL